MDDKNFHVQYLDVTSQYWSPQSAQFAGGDHLLTALTNGWDIVSYEEKQHWYAGSRCVTVYHFTLARNNEQMLMPVINNPYIERFLQQSELNNPQAEPKRTSLAS